MVLARAFQTGLESSLWLGADIIVNTDADNQYNADDIQKLIDPIINHNADYVVGVRPISDIEHFSPTKKKLQKIGSRIVSGLGKNTIEDTTSGFRAMNRKTALRLNIFNDYTYTLETLIQSGQLKLCTVSVPIRVNAKTRSSRLISSTFDYLKRSSTTIIRSFLTYNPLKFFITGGSIAMVFALALAIRYLFFYFNGDGMGHVQSLLLAVILFVGGSSAWMLGFQADLTSVNRKLIEDVLQRVKRVESTFLNKSDHDFPDLTDARWDYLDKNFLKSIRKNEQNK